MPELVTIPNVPLIETGVDWPASTGPVTFTESHLRAAAEAPYSDPAVKLPRMRFGHTGAGTTPSQSADHKFEQPCVGKFVNLRVGDEGNTLYGDLMGVPKWLAEILPTAYPNRSVEAFFGVTTSTERKHEMIITSVALLGENLPGVQTLDDLEYLFSDEPSEWIEALTADAKVAASQSRPGGDPIPEQRVAASVDTGDVRSAFYEQVAVDDRYYWWLHQLYLDPAVMIAEDENMEYWLVPYSTSASDVECGEPVQVFIQWVEKESGKVAASAAIPKEFGQPAQVWASADESRPAGRENNHKEATAAMAIDIPALRSALGLSDTDLPDDATEEQINEALAAQAQAGSTDEPEGDDEQPGTPETEGDEPEGAQASANADVITVDRAIWEETRRGAQAGLELQRRQAREENAAFVDAAVQAGKISPATRESYLSQMNGPSNDGNGPAKASIRSLIDGLPAGVIPVEEIGHSEGESTKAQSSEGTGLFPDLESRRQQAQEA